MNLYNASTSISLIHEVRYITNTTSTSYPDVDLKRNINRYYHLLTGEILGCQDNWDFQGETATAYLVADQREYRFPTDLLKIKKIQLKLDGTNWRDATIFDINENPGVAMTSETDITNYYDNATPYIEILDQSLFIYSGTITNVTAGMQIWYEHEVTELVADSDEPLIVEPYQRALIYGAAKDYFARYNLREKAVDMNTELENTLSRLRVFYGSRVQDKIIIAKSAVSSENYE